MFTHLAEHTDGNAELVCNKLSEAGYLTQQRASVSNEKI